MSNAYYIISPHLPQISLLHFKKLELEPMKPKVNKEGLDHFSSEFDKTSKTA